MNELTQGPGAAAPSYHRSQFGWLSFVPLGLSVALLWVGPTHALAGAAIVAYSVLVAALAATRGVLTVSVDHADIRWSLGIGVLQASVALRAVRRVELVTVRFPNRGFPEGYAYGASTQSSVRLSLADGRQELIRSSDPFRLADAIERQLESVRMGRGGPEERRGAATPRSGKSYRVARSRRGRDITVVLNANQPQRTERLFELLSVWTLPRESRSHAAAPPSTRM